MVSFSDPFRLEIIDLMMDGEVCVCDIMKLTKLSQSRISYHIKILKEAGLISDRQEGRWVYYSLNKKDFINKNILIHQIILMYNFNRKFQSNENWN